MAENIPTKILFVCTGNICRSPMAEGMFRHILTAHDTSRRFIVDSAGTIGDHAGNPPHPKAQAAMRLRGVDISQLRARKFSADDIDKFDWIIALDRGNMRYIRSLANGAKQKDVKLLMGFTENWTVLDVPDPLLSSTASFETVVEMVEDACFDLFYELEDLHQK